MAEAIARITITSDLRGGRNERERLRNCSSLAAFEPFGSAPFIAVTVLLRIGPGFAWLGSTRHERSGPSTQDRDKDPLGLAEPGPCIRLQEPRMPRISH